jgi:hypothetical protein
MFYGFYRQLQLGSRVLLPKSYDEWRRNDLVGTKKVHPANGNFLCFIFYFLEVVLVVSEQESVLTMGLISIWD